MTPRFTHPCRAGSYLYTLAHSCVLPVALGCALLFAPGAWAQSNSCDQLKGVLAERIDKSIQGYSMETVPASAPVPRDAKVIGTCEGGASKILYRRFGAQQPTTDTAATNAAPAPTTPIPTAPASTVAAPTAPVAVPVPVAPTREPQAPVVPVARVAPTPALPSTPPPVAKLPVPVTPTPTPSTPAKPAPSIGVPVVTAPVVVQPEKLPQIAAPTVQATAPIAPATLPSESIPPGPFERAGFATVPSAPQVTSFMTEKWRWFWVALVLVLAAALWAWRSHHNAYDANGLPRGPKL